MKIINYTKPKLLIADENHHIRAINDIYKEEYIDEKTGEIIPEHIPYYATVIFLADNFDENRLNELYVEEKIEKE